MDLGYHLYYANHVSLSKKLFCFLQKAAISKMWHIVVNVGVFKLKEKNEDDFKVYFQRLNFENKKIVLLLLFLFLNVYIIPGLSFIIRLGQITKDGEHKNSISNRNTKGTFFLTSKSGVWTKICFFFREW